MPPLSWMIYGAYGYTGALTAELALARGHRPVLAGRSAAKLAPLAARLGLEHRSFDLDTPESVRAGVAGMGAVLHCAGPFSATSRPVVDACLATGAHYLDITGEIGVFEAVARRGAEARAAGVVLLPGAGFDVVPTDCLAAMLKQRLPTATHLELAFQGVGGLSPGTTKTALEGMGQAGGAARIDGRIQTVPPAWKTRTIAFPPVGDEPGPKTLHAVSIPWGDVSTAFHSTGIPNITCYLALPPKAVAGMRWAGRLRPLMASGPVQALGRWWIGRKVQGPDAAARQSGFSRVWGEVRDADGKVVSLGLTTAGGYSLTADSGVQATLRLLEGAVAPGFHTPSTAFGADYVLSLEGSRLYEPAAG